MDGSQLSKQVQRHGQAAQPRLAVHVERVGVAAAEHDAHKERAHVDGHALQLARLQAAALVAVEREAAQQYAPTTS